MTNAEIESFAKQTLIDHNMYSIPVDPVRLANSLGIKVSNAVFSSNEISGMIAKRAEKTSLLVNDSHSIERKRFTIAHELGHQLLHLHDDGEYVDNDIDFFRGGDSNTNDQNRRQEIEANKFAAALLMDEDQIKSYWAELHSIEKMADLFGVSIEAMGNRLNTLRLI